MAQLQTPHRPRRSASLTAALTALATGITLGVLPAAPALADTDPVTGVPETVTAEALPTVQIDGVAWKVALHGNTAYAGGEFTNARPAGALPGAGTMPRRNLLAFDVRTGALQSWAPNPNGSVQALALSPDGSRLYV